MTSRNVYTQKVLAKSPEHWERCCGTSETCSRRPLVPHNVTFSRESCGKCAKMFRYLCMRLLQFAVATSSVICFLFLFGECLLQTLAPGLGPIPSSMYPIPCTIHHLGYSIQQMVPVVGPSGVSLVVVRWSLSSWRANKSRI